MLAPGQHRRFRGTTWSSCVILAALSGVLDGVSPDRACGKVWVARTIESLPRTDAECAAAHEKSVDICRRCRAKEPEELPNFAGRTEYDVLLDEAGARVARQLPFDFSRLNVLSYGLTMTPADRRALPWLSRGTIAGYVDGDYVNIQVRVHRDAAGAVYLYSKPFAGVLHYGQEGHAEETLPLVEESIRNVRGLGLWLNRAEPLSADSFRTMVVLNRTTVFTGGEGPAGLAPRYEFLFIRLRVDGERITPHVVVTTEGRTRWRYVEPYSRPKSADDCTVKSTIAFTAYDVTGLVPRARANRLVVARTLRDYLPADLDQFVKSLGRSGDALDHLTTVLDAIIDDRAPRAKRR